MKFVINGNGDAQGWAMPAMTPGQLLQAMLWKHLRGNYAPLSVVVFEGQEYNRRVVEVH